MEKLYSCINSLKGLDEIAKDAKLKKYSSEGSMLLYAEQITGEKPRCREKEINRYLDELDRDRKYINSIKNDDTKTRQDILNTILLFVDEFEKVLKEVKKEHVRKKVSKDLFTRFGNTEENLVNFRNNIFKVSNEEKKEALVEYRRIQNEIVKIKRENKGCDAALFNSYLEYYEYTIIYLESLIKYTSRPNPLLNNNVKEYESEMLDNAISYIFVADSLEKSKAMEKEYRLAYQKEYGLIGEKQVDYALKWLKPSDYIMIEGRAANALGNVSILLQSDEYPNMSQEFDHIVVGKNGVFSIETKNYSGKITIDKYGNWKRMTEDGEKGVLNPLQQVRRHEKILSSILSNEVEIVSIICIANDSAIISGLENTPVVVIKYDQLVEFIETYSNKNVNISCQKMEEYVDLISAHMIVK